MEGFNPEQAEKLKFKYHYTYTDGKVLGCPKIFECDANDDVEAEENFLTFVQESGLDIVDSEIHRSSTKN